MKKIHQLFRAFALFSLVCSTALFAADHSGTWTKKSQKIDGTWTIAEGKISLTGLSTRKAPDLKLFLSPLPVAELSNKNAEQGAVFIADLKSNKGDQTYPLPADLDLSAPPVHHHALSAIHQTLGRRRPLISSHILAPPPTFSPVPAPPRTSSHRSLPRADQ